VPHAGMDQPWQDQLLVDAQARFPVRACAAARRVKCGTAEARWL
jgi:hypothetical protein